ncbi:MAG: hypothetical protein K0S22_638 [Oscillospiraceae bacterium]|nr:hypothetical protein [Oscillospiraceae bacterium]
MKRLSILAAVVTCCLLQASCAAPSTDKSSAPSGSVSGSVSGSTSSQPASSTPSSNAGGNVRVGLGIVSTTSESSAASSGATGNAKFNAVGCAVCVDADGKILDVKFDTMQASVGFDVSGALTGDVTSELKTKKELGDAYGMKQASGIKKEWYEQIAALEAWMRGKKVEDVLAMKVTERDNNKKDVPDEADLKTSVTISVTDQLRALDKAYANAK